jgi:hypothetical protein
MIAPSCGALVCAGVVPLFVRTGSPGLATAHPGEARSRDHLPMSATLTIRGQGATLSVCFDGYETYGKRKPRTYYDVNWLVGAFEIDQDGLDVVGHDNETVLTDEVEDFRKALAQLLVDGTGKADFHPIDAGSGATVRAVGGEMKVYLTGAARAVTVPTSVELMRGVIDDLDRVLEAFPVRPAPGT